LGEGTLWSQSRAALYWVDILSKKLHRYTPARDQRETWTFDETISAAVERTSSPTLLVTMQSGFAFFDPESGRLEHHHNPEPDRPGNRFNDGKCDPAGRFWGGTMDFACKASSGALYCLDAQRRCVRHLDDWNITNGPTWSSDGRTMYFTETGRGQINAFDFSMATGALSNRRLWLQFAGAEGKPDGMTTDADGRIWIAHWGGSCVTCRDVTGRVLTQIDLPTAHITDVAFGGPDLTTLFISSATDGLSVEQRAQQPLAGGLFAVEVDARGVPAPQFSG
jgi:sugar lactone lactonase YvrE